MSVTHKTKCSMFTKKVSNHLLNNMDSQEALALGLKYVKGH